MTKIEVRQRPTTDHRRPTGKALLVLSDGTIFEGRAFGADGETSGEVVFNTSMTGYQEILTDPSYCGQIITMTYPMIGNYGCNRADVESDRVHARGFIVKEACRWPSNWRGEVTLDQYLKDNDVIGIEGIDTRALVRHIREQGAQPGIISTTDLDAKRLVKKAKDVPGMSGQDLVGEVTCTKPYTWQEGLVHLPISGLPQEEKEQGRPVRVVVFDFGIKRNILRSLVEVGCEVEVVPAGFSSEDVLKKKPDGVFLSNGPGDPAPVTYAIDTIRNLMGKIPIFGICLGHQLMGLALDGTTSKLKFGHRGGNQPVMDLATRSVQITSQNHGFTVDVDSLKGEVEMTHLNLNDKTVEGIKHKRYPAFSVQYHPEASPGPHDSMYLFKEFLRLVRG